MAQQTAVDWLVNKIYMVIPNEERNFLEGLREQAKAIEKEQQNEIYRLKAIVEFYEEGCGLEGCKAKEPHVH